MLKVTKGQGFTYQEVNSVTVLDILFNWFTLASLICIVLIIIMLRIHESSKSWVLRLQVGFTLMLMILAVGLPFLGGAYAKDNAEAQQNDTDKQSIAEDYGVEVISVSRLYGNANKSTDDVSIKNVIVKVDNAVIECQQYVITASNRYYVTCGENTPLEEFVS